MKKFSSNREGQTFVSISGVLRDKNGDSPPAGYRPCGVLRLHGVRWSRVSAGLDGAESAAASAGVAEKHDGCSRDAVPFTSRTSPSIPALKKYAPYTVSREIMILQAPYSSSRSH